jgi:hypothetical protein
VATFGNTTAGGDSFPCSNDRALGSKFTLTEAGNVTAVNCRFDVTSTAGANYKGVIYNDSAGSPGSRVAVGAATAVPAGGGVVASSITASLSAGDYWLVSVTDSFQSIYEIELTGVSQRKEAFTYASPADPFGTPDGSSTELCIYATYTASVSASPGPNPRQIYIMP